MGLRLVDPRAIDGVTSVCQCLVFLTSVHSWKPEKRAKVFREQPSPEHNGIYAHHAHFVGA